MEINRISDHAVEKYRQYMCELYEKEITDDARARIKIMELFNKAHLENPTAGLIKRIINNEFQDATYYRYFEWRFVVCNNVIVTIERNVFKKPKLINFKQVNRNFRRKKRIKDIQTKRR